MPLPCFLKSPIFCFSVTGECTSVPHYVWLLLDPRAGKGGMALYDPVNSFLMVLPCDSRLSYVKLFPLSLVFECKKSLLSSPLFSTTFLRRGKTQAPPSFRIFSLLAPGYRACRAHKFFEISVLILDFIWCFQRSRHRLLSSALIAVIEGTARPAGANFF